MNNKKLNKETEKMNSNFFPSFNVEDVGVASLELKQER